MEVACTGTDTGCWEGRADAAACTAVVVAVVVVRSGTCCIRAGFLRTWEQEGEGFPTDLWAYPDTDHNLHRIPHRSKV